MKGDYRSLAAAFGKSWKYTDYLEAAGSSPVALLLRDCNPTLSCLCRMLLKEEVDRSDVVEDVKTWVKQQGHNCSACCAPR